tara:strand:+ start:798 stop:1493 length:696 start_codon:yes stop_codon:yes gene_type:complete
MPEYIKGDIHDVIKTIEDNTVDLIYSSPPFGITGAEWDKPLDWKTLFVDMWRVVKPNGIIILHASMPFTYELLKYETPKYHYIWEKNICTNFFHAKKQPLRKCEEVLIYYKKSGTYNPQMIGTEFRKKRNVMYGGKEKYFGDCKVDGWGEETNEGGHTGRYPNTLLKYDTRKGKGNGITRGDDMIDFFIKTYTNEDDTVLDMTHHNKIVGNRCEILKRKYIGVDINPDFRE